MSHSPTPNWQPLTALPRLAAIVDQALDSAQTQFRNLRHLCGRPYILDEAFVRLVIDHCSEHAEGIPVYRQQLHRWAQLDLTDHQRREVARLERQLDTLDLVLSDILTLAEELKQKTVEQVLGKDEVDRRI